ncbi:MAG: carboxylesterase family protein [Saprospiraceae bacterium]
MKKLSLTLCLLAALHHIMLAQQITGEDIAVTNTESGKVRGYISNGIYTFKGIPYAKAERFSAPQKPDAWQGVRSSMTWGPVAPLITPTTQVADEVEFIFDHDWGYTNENCLVLNVWTPGLNDGKKRPVMFWIHGGGFTAGSSQELPSYHGENLADLGDVVVVSVNHRLNILGFLDLSAYGQQYEYSANNSILDLRVALEWVRDNIENFGGDPGNVTIFGQSGGGAKVNTLMAMPSATGLFHKAVNQSGSFRMNMLEKSWTQAITAEVLKELNLGKNDIEKLKTLPYAALATAGQKALKTVEVQMKDKGEAIPGFGLNWGPSRDGELLPYQLLSKEAMELSKNIPLLIGTVKNEFMPSLGNGLSGASEADVMAFLQKEHGGKTGEFVAAVKAAYPSDTRPSDLMDIDRLFRPGAVFQANEKSGLQGGAPVFMYLFSWQSPVMDGKYKAIHCMELPFVFNNIQRCKNMTGGGREAQNLADKVSQAWINFAHTGNPNHSGLPEWEPYTGENGTTMFFDNHCHIRHHHDEAYLKLIAQ